MLSGLDETLMHQGPLPFSLAMLQTTTAFTTDTW